MGNVCRCDSRRSNQQQMNVIFLHIQSAKYPPVRFTQATNFLFYKCSNLPGLDPLTVLGTPDKVAG